LTIAIQVQLMNRFLQYPRVWLRLQDCEGSSVPSWYNAHLVTNQYLGGRVARLKSTFFACHTLVHISDCRGGA
jgi:hypothetical protein